MMHELAERLGLAFLADPWLPKVLVAIFLTVAINFLIDRLLEKATSGRQKEHQAAKNCRRAATSRA